MAYLEPCEVRLVGAERRGRGSLLLAAAAVSATTHRKPAAAPRHKRPELLQAPSPSAAASQSGNGSGITRLVKFNSAYVFFLGPL